jgi:hypothetical protein
MSAKDIYITYAKLLYVEWGERSVTHLFHDIMKPNTILDILYVLVVGKIKKMKAVVTDKGFKFFMESTWRY